MFTKSTKTWFEDTFGEPTEVQRRGWKVIVSGAHSLLVAPTGSGKTLAAFLAAIDRLSATPAAPRQGVRVLYISPLKALVYDIERNLRAPLVGVRRVAERLNEPWREVRVDVRTGDTPQQERRRQARDPGDILVTTPESLFLLLGSRARESLATVETVIVDEVHALAPVKRGTHLALSLERLSALTRKDPQRIGLSATVKPLDEAARFLGGSRPVEIVDAARAPKLDLTVSVPVPDMENVPREPTGGSILGELYSRELAPPPSQRGIWPAIYPQLVQTIREHRTTIVFVNSRGLCERLAHKLNELAEEPLVRAHHGSVSQEQRAEIEESLKAGRLRGIVATSSLELGIDMGAVDLVVLVESPGSVARGLQRIGRAGHQVDAVSKGQIIPKFRGDLLECAVLSQRMHTAEIESMRVPRKALDVLAQQIVAACVDQPREVDEIEQIVTRSYPFRDLSRPALEAVLDMLSGRYPSDDFADLRPLLAWDRAANELRPRRGAAMASRLNAGTIPDRGTFAVHLGAEGPRVGELDEEMVYETRRGDHILLGATTWRVEEITRDRVIVTPAPGEPGRLPFWRGDGPGRPYELGRAVGAFVRELVSQGSDRAVDWLTHNTVLDRFAAENLRNYVFEQLEHAGAVPTDRTVVVERFRDELGDWRVCILTPFGARIHAPWAMALQTRLTSERGHDVQLMYTDDGIVLRFADTDDPPPLDMLLPEADALEELVTDQLAQTALFAGLFRENAVRSLLLRRRGPQKRTPLWAQRLKAQNLLATVRKYPNFPIVLETYRQAMSDVFDLPALKQVLGEISQRRIRVHEADTPSASPFSRSLVFAYVAAFIYEQDAPLAERKAQALTLDRGLLGELLGQDELRELIDPGVLADLEAELQRLAAGRQARDADEVHDLCRWMGDLTESELAERSSSDVAAAVAQLERERRAIRVVMAGEKRLIAAEDAGLYRDALGVMPPPGLPDGFLAPVQRSLEKLVRRFARSHGPFTARAIASRYALAAGQVETVLRELEREGLLVHGEIRPGGAELDWCDADVLRKLKRRTLAKLRHEVAPVDARTLATFLPEWHGIGSSQGGEQRLLECIAQLEGLALPWSMLSTVILPARVAGFSLDMLDMLSATGAIAWIGAGPLGATDGRVALYLRHHAAMLLAPPGAFEGERVHDEILRVLEARGASFYFELEQGVRDENSSLTSAEFRAALWDLAWAGHITNDTFAPLKSIGRRSSSRSRRSRRGLHAHSGGRWSLVQGLIDTRTSDTARWLARAEVLLERYGIVSREAAYVEELPSGFSTLYQVLKTMEESGRVRRGYFVEGLTGSQFGHVGAVDRLRSSRTPADSDTMEEADIAILAAVDPANPFGSLLPWPDTPGETRPRRVPGAWLMTVRGKPCLYVSPGGRQLVTFEVDPDSDELTAAFRALHKLPKLGRRALLVIEKIDGQPVRQSPHQAALAASGFAQDYRGMTAVTQ